MGRIDEISERVKQKRFEQDVAKVDDEYLRRFSESAGSYLDSAQKQYEGLNYGNSYQSYLNRRDSYNDLDYRRRVIQEWNKRNPGKLDQQATSFLDSFGKDSKSILDAFSGVRDYFSQFATEGDYEKSLYRPMTKEEAAQGEADMRKKLEEYRRSDRRTADAEAASQNALGSLWYNPANLDLQLMQLPGMGLNQEELGYERAIDYYIQQGKFAQDRELMEADVAEVQAMGQEWQDLFDTYMVGKYDLGNPYTATDAAAVRDQLYAKFGKERAEELAESWMRYRSQQGSEEIQQWGQQHADSGVLGKVAASAATVFANAMGTLTAPVGYLIEAGSRTGRYQTLDPNNPGALAGQYASTVRGEIAKDIEGEDPGFGRKMASYAYQGSLSAADNLVRIAMGGGTKIGSLGLAAVGSFGSTLSEASSKGATPGEAVLLGVANAGLELLTEKYSIDNLFKAAEGGVDSVKAILRNVFQQAGVEASEEELSFLGGLAAEALILREKSGYRQQIGELVAKGYSGEEAKELADRAIWQEALDTAITSAISGSMMTGTTGTAQYAGRNAQVKKQYGEFQNELVAEGLESDVGSESYALAEKYQAKLDKGKNLTGGQLNRLIQANEKQFAVEQQAAEEAAAEDQGDDLPWEQESDTPEMEAYLRAVRETTEETPATVRGNRIVAEKAPVIASSDASNATNNATSQQKTQLSGEKTTADNSAEEAQEKTITRQASTGKEVTPQKIVSIENGKAMIQTDEGTIAADDIEFATGDMDLLWRSAVDFKGINASGANGVIRAYREGDSVTTYLEGAGQEFQNGYYNLPSGGDYADKLAPWQRELIYELGQKAAGENTAKEQAKATAAKKSEATVSNSESVGKVHFDRNGRTFDSVREVSLKAMEQMSAALGMEFHVFESYVNEAGKRVYKDAKGNEVHAPNGYYDPKNGSIHIDLNAGADGKGTMLFTISHELTHFIKQWSPAKFKVLADFLTEKYGEEGVSVNKLVDAQIAKAKRSGRELSWEDAYEEMVADSMEAMLTDGNVVQMMADLKQQDKTLWQKICDWFKDLAADLKAIVDAYKGVKPNSHEGKMVAQMQDVIVTLESLYHDALTDASENYQAAGARKNTAQEGGDVKYQARKGMSDSEIGAIQGIGRVSVNAFTSQDIKATESLAKRYWAEMGVKSPFFRAWFGDWRINDVTPIQIADQHGNTRGVQRNEDTGWDINVSGQVFSETRNHKDSYNVAARPYLPYINDIVNKAILLDSYGVDSAKVKSHNSLLMHSLYAVADIGNGREVLKLYVEEMNNPNADNTTKRSYQLQNIEKYHPAAKGSQKASPVSAASGTIKTIADMFRYVKQRDSAFAPNPASKIVDKDGTPKIVYHGSYSNFSVFDGKARKHSSAPNGSYFFTDNMDVGYSYTGYKNIANPGGHAYKGGVYPVYLNIRDPLVIDFGGQHWSEKLNGKDVNEWAQYAKDNGYDGLIAENIIDEGGQGDQNWDENAVRVPATDYVVFESTQIKSATDNIGTYDSTNSDIRYSERDPELQKVNRVLEKENAELKRDVAYLKELVKLQNQVTGGTKFTKSSVEAAAGQLIKYADAKGSKAELVMLLNSVYEYIARGQELTWEGVKEAAQPAVEWLQSHVRTKVERSAYAQDVLKEIRNSKVYLDEQQKQEVAYKYGSYNEFRKKCMGSVILTDSAAMSLDSQWHEWAGQYPNLFDPNISSTDMPGALMEVFDSLRSMTEMDYGYDQELFGQELLSRVYDSYWNVSTLYTVKDKAQKEINRLKYEHTKRMSKLREDHKTATAKLKQDHQADLEAVRQEMRDRAEKQRQNILAQHEVSRKKGAENRHKAEMRRKIRRTVMDLKKILNKGDKKRNVKEDMKDLVAEALRSADVLFTDNYSNEDMVRNGVGVELTAQESKYLEEAAALMEQLDNLPSGGYEAFQQRQESEAQLKNRLGYRMAKLRDVFERERARLNKSKVSEVLGSLADAYASLQNSEQSYVSEGYHENVYQYLLMLKGDVGGTTVKDMSLHQLEELHKAYTMVLTTVRNANKMFAANLKQTREQLGNQTIAEVQKAGGEHGLWAPGEDKISAFSWNNEKPVYAFERIGSETLTRLFENTRAGEDSWAQDMTEARAYYLAQAKKHRYDSWNFDKQYKFTSSSGIDFSLNLEQIMSLYAYSKREQAHDHLMKGGFVFDGNTEVQVNKMGVKLTYLNKTAKAHNVSPEILGDIVSKLTAEQKAFVDEMQDYLSTTMGGKGNEVSMQMYGVKLFNEKYYFPLRSAGQYMERAKEADLKKQQGQISIVNSGFTKATTPKSNNPVVLSGFMDAWTDHVNEMSMYHSFVLPMEDFRRVYNYASPNVETGRSISVNSVIQDAYGEAATGYIDQLYRDLNGGAVSDPRETPAKALMGKFKKAAVFASASVVVQQPSAIGRAFAIIDPKYFIGAKVDHKRHKQLWAEVKKYAPVATIKEMGYFDTGMGKSAQDFIKGKEYGSLKEKAAALFTDADYRDEVLGMAPALADELTWCAIWEAAKRETRAKNPKMNVKSEAFLQAAGKRFTEVITKTQVYDSVLSRSANMRSKGAFMNMWTAFMAEPTTTINMVEDALRKAKKGDKKYAARAMGAVMASVVINSLLSSVVYAMRDDEEDETFLEKYVQSFATEILDGINPITYYPFLKDVWSVLQGYDIERSDMSLITSLVEKITKLVQVYSKDTTEMDEEELAKHQKSLADAWWGVTDYLTALGGIPVKNVRRDINGVFNMFRTISQDLTDRDTSWGSLIDKTWDDVKNAIPVVGWFPDATAADKLYKATVSGDTAYQKRLESAYSSQTSLDNAIRKGLRANDSRIWEAAVAWNNNDLEAYKRIAKEIISEGHFSQDNVVMAIQAEAKAMLPKESESTSVVKAKGYFTAEKFAVAVSQSNGTMASAIKADIIDTAMRNGKTQEEAQSSFASSAKTQMEEMYLAGGITQKQVIGALMDYCDYEQEAAEKLASEWGFERKYGVAYDDRSEAYKNGTISASALKKILMDVGGKTEVEAELQIQVYDWQKEGFNIESGQTGIVKDYNDYCEPAGIDKKTYFDAYLFYEDSGEEGVAYSKTKECVVYINSLPLTAEQKTALALCWWAESTVRKYKLW